MPAATNGEAVASDAIVSTSEYHNVGESFAVIKQDVEIEINFREKSISGYSHIHIFPFFDDLEEIALDARQCEIDVDNITVDGLKTSASFQDPYDLMNIPKQWQVGAGQHHIVRNRMKPLMPEKRPEIPIHLRESEALGCVPADRSIKVSLRPESQSKDDPRRTLKIKTAKVNPDISSEGVKISIPFKSKNIRDGLHFVGCDEGDTRYPHVYTRHSIEPGTASCIFPCVDDPGSRHAWKISITCPRTLGDAFKQPLATQSAPVQPLSSNRKRKAGEAVAAPPEPQFPLLEEDKLTEITVICSGNLIHEQTDPKDESKKIMSFECHNSAAQHIAFAVGPFEHIDLWSEFRTEEADEKLGVNAAKIHAYCLPGRTEEVLHTCAPIVSAADYFAPEFGRYPYESYKMAFVEDMIPDTVAATSMSLCTTRLLYDEQIIDPEIEVTRTLVHALASQYLGVHIVPNQRSDSWLVIGIQWFMTDLFMKTLCGNNWYRFHIKTLMDKLVEIDVNRPSLHDLGEHLHIGDFELEFMSLKAHLVLFILDQRMSKIPGSTGVIRVVSQLVSTANIASQDAKATSISAADFRRSCEKRSQYRPDELWDQWVMCAGCPKLNIKQRFNKKNLNVDISITQKQETVKSKTINKDDFWREYQEEIHGVYAGEVPKLFTGPFTVRIHEADGTPYEHYQVISDKDKTGTNLQIAYNTKYKRLKRTKKAMAAASTNTDKHEIQEDDVIYFNMLGDVLTAQKDYADWGLQEWSDQVQQQMDQESYEWIRLDGNCEWVADIFTDMPGYMYLAQLQQDRDVVAHQDALLFFRRSRRHGVAATIETRTVIDRRYFHGIRTMAVEDLAKQADPDLNYVGLFQLILCFRHFFCNKMVGKNGVTTFPPHPNDFHDKAQYAVQCAIPAAVARTRKQGRCSRDGRNFLLELLLFNDNSENEYSDQFYVAKLLEALTTSLIPEKYDRDRELINTLQLDDDDDREFHEFINRTIEEIDKYRRMDEWTSTYQNIWTTTALECKMRLMKARVIPASPLEFVQYLQDDNIDLVRLKAFECLVELGMIAKAPIMKLLLSYMSTDKSPFVRDRLFKIFCRGIAAIAFGENKALQPQPDPETEVEDSGLIIEQGDAEIQQRKLDAVRREDINQSLRALKEELKGNTELQIAIWKAVNSEIIGLKEMQQLLELCSAMFEQEDSLEITLNYPKGWRVTRESSDNSISAFGAPTLSKKKSLIMKFSTYYKTTPRSSRNPPEILPPPQAVPYEQPLETKPSEPKKIKLSSKSSFSGPSGGIGSPAPTPQPRKESISVVPARAVQPLVTPTTPIATAPPSDSIAVQPMARVVSTPLAMSPPPLPRAPSSSYQPNGGSHVARPAGDKHQRAPGSSKPLKKRKSDHEGFDSHDRPPKKVAKVTNGTGSGRSRVVTLRFTKWDRLSDSVQKSIRKERTPAATIVATPAANRFNSGVSNSSAANDYAYSRSSPAPRSPVPSTPSGGSGYNRFSGGSTSTGGDRDRDRDRGRDYGYGQHSSSSGSGLKHRKPLPSAPVHGGPPPSTPAGGGGGPLSNTTPNGNGTPVTGGPPKKMIKLKVKSSTPSSSQRP